MSDKVIEVQPIKTATYNAIQWDEEHGTEELIRALGKPRYWKVNGVLPTRVFGQKVSTLVLTVHRTNKQYRLLKGDWLVIGEHGSIRTVSDATFRRDYKETSK